MEAYVLVQTEVGGAEGVATEIAVLRGVQSAAVLVGPYDVMVRAEARNLDDLAKLVVVRIQAIKGVTRTLTCPIIHL